MNMHRYFHEPKACENIYLCVLVKYLLIMYTDLYYNYYYMCTYLRISFTVIAMPIFSLSVSETHS